VLALALLEGTLRVPAYRLWAAADFGHTPGERAAWVVPDASEGLRWVNWPDGRRFLTAHWKGPVPPGAVAIVHTHPAVVDPKPSAQDVNTARGLGLPVYTVSRSGIWKVVPGGSIVAVDDRRWWSVCRTGGCEEARHPEFRSVRGHTNPEDSRNFETDSAYP